MKRKIIARNENIAKIDEKKGGGSVKSKGKRKM